MPSSSIAFALPSHHPQGPGRSTARAMRRALTGRVLGALPTSAAAWGPLGRLLGADCAAGATGAASRGPHTAQASRGVASSGGGGSWHRHQGEPGWYELGYSSELSHHAADGSGSHLYSLHASEWQQQHYLLSAAARRAAAEAEVEAGVGDRYVPIEPLASGDAYEAPSRPSRPGATTLSEDEEEAAMAAHCAQCGPLSEPDFYEGTADFTTDNQLVLRSTWLCSGATSLADMRARLEERVRFLDELEKQGWELMEAVDDEYACLHNKQPKPHGLAEAWAIVERWEEGVEWERWPGPGRRY